MTPPADAQPAEQPAPKPLTVKFKRRRSKIWSKDSFLATVNSATSPGHFDKIDARRKQLRNQRATLLHDSYQGTEVKHDETRVTADMISLPPRYGQLLYALARGFGARTVLEAGAGFGISTMYLAQALQDRAQEPDNTPQSGRITSFEIQTYALKAQHSLAMITGDDPTAQVIRDDFNALGLHLPGEAAFDMAFIDARHDCETILRNYKCARGWMQPCSMIVIDDIRYSDSSQEGWAHLLARKDYPFAALINDRFGVLSS